VGLVIFEIFPPSLSVARKCLILGTPPVPAAAGETPALPEPPDFDDAPLDFRVNLFSEGKRGLVSAKKLLAGGGQFCIVSPHWFVLLTFYGITS
jgi:hypothetical protein